LSEEGQVFLRLAGAMKQPGIFAKVAFQVARAGRSIAEAKVVRLEEVQERKGWVGTSTMLIRASSGRDSAFFFRRTYYVSAILIRQAMDFRLRSKQVGC